MRRYILPGLVAVAAVALLALLAFGVGGQNPGSSIDAQVARGDYPVAPSLTPPLPRARVRSAQTSLAAYRGKVVVLNVFASWCDPCKAEAPVLADAQRSLSAHGATVLGVTYLDNPHRLRAVRAPGAHHLSGDARRQRQLRALVRDHRRARDVRDQPPGPRPGAAALPARRAAGCKTVLPTILAARS